MGGIVALVLFLVLGCVMWKICWDIVTGHPQSYPAKKARVVHPPVAIPKRPSAFDPAGETALYLTDEDKRFFNRIARLMEQPEPYPYSEPYDAEAKMKAAGYTREMPEGEWESITTLPSGTWYIDIAAMKRKNNFNKEFTESLQD